MCFTPSTQREIARLTSKLSTFIELEHLVDPSEDPEGKVAMREQIEEIRTALARLG